MKICNLVTLAFIGFMKNEITVAMYSSFFSLYSRDVTYFLVTKWMSTGVTNVKNPAIVHTPIVAAKLLPTSAAFWSNIGWIQSPTPLDINDKIFNLRIRGANIPV